MTAETEIQERVDTDIRIAASPHGDSASLREREQAASRLLAHGKLAYDRLTQLVRDKPQSIEAPRLIELVGLFKEDESVALLKKLLVQGKQDTSRAAGRALAVIDTAAARHALEEGLRSDGVEARIAAVDGVRLSGDKSWCPLVTPLLQDRNANLRYYAVNAAAELGCLDAEHLNRICQSDDDEYVRELASKWMKGTD